MGSETYMMCIRWFGFRNLPGYRPALQSWMCFCCCRKSRIDPKTCVARVATCRNVSNQHVRPTFKNGSSYHDLVGGWTNPFEKYARQIGSFPQVGIKIKNIWVATSYHDGFYLSKIDQRKRANRESAGIDRWIHPPLCASPRNVFGQAGWNVPKSQPWIFHDLPFWAKILIKMSNMSKLDRHFFVTSPFLKKKLLSGDTVDGNQKSQGQPPEMYKTLWIMG